MIVLGIETSCDETAASVVYDGHDVRSSIISSQVAKHALYGGVIPELAAREHLKAIHPIVTQALTEADVSLADVDGIAVTQSPGLMPALLVGLSYAKGLAAATGKPFVGINHFLAHLFGAFIDEPQALKSDDVFPIMALVVSGGHTALVLVEETGECRIVGRTLDDAAGEAFDKAAKILNLPYPGGPVIDALAKEGNSQAHRFPRGLCGDNGQAILPKNRYNFSFSGVKTSLLYKIKGHSNSSNLEEPIDVDEQEMRDVVASYQEAIVDALVRKTIWATEAFDCTSVVVCGGVACNSRLRERVDERCREVGRRLLIAPPKYCTDNAAMIAGLGYYYLRNELTTDLTADASPRLGELGHLPFAKEYRKQ